MSYIYSLTDTWNAGGTTFTAIKMNVTDTASASGSLLMDLQVGGSSRFSVRKDGLVISQSAIRGTDLNVTNANGQLTWNFDTVLTRDAADTLAQRNGTNAQAFRVYNTFTDASNYERATLTHTATAFQIAVEGAGSGSASRFMLLRAASVNWLSLGASGTTGGAIWNINTNGHLLAGTDNTYDIGAAAATRPRNVYVAGTLNAPTIQLDTNLLWTNGRLSPTADGVFRISNAGVTDFGRLQFGGTTSSFPSLKRSSATLQARLADDSAFAAVAGLVDLTATQAADSIGTRGVPQNSQSAAYTLVAEDAGKHILHPSADTTARTFTIPANGTVPFAVGTVVTFVNQNAGGVITIAITTDTMRLAGAGTTGSRTLAANGIATAIKVTSTEWLISGTGLT